MGFGLTLTICNFMAVFQFKVFLYSCCYFSAKIEQLKEYEETATFVMDPVAFEMFTSLQALA